MPSDMSSAAFSLLSFAATAGIRLVNQIPAMTAASPAAVMQAARMPEPSLLRTHSRSPPAIVNRLPT